MLEETFLLSLLLPLLLLLCCCSHIPSLAYAMCLRKLLSAIAGRRNNADVFPDDDSALLLAQGNADASPMKTLDKIPSVLFGEILLFCGDTLDDPMPLVSSRTKEMWEAFVKWRTAEIAALFKYPFQFIPDSSVIQRYYQIVAARNRFSADILGLLHSSAYSTSQQQPEQVLFDGVVDLLGRNPVIEFECKMLVVCSQAIALRADYVVEQGLLHIVNTLVDRSRSLFEEATEPRDEERTAYVEALKAQLGCRQRQWIKSHAEDDFNDLISVARTILQIDPRNPVGLSTLSIYYFHVLQDIRQTFHSLEEAIRSACSHARYACVTHSYCEQLLTLMEGHLIQQYWQNRIIALFRDAISSLGRLLERTDVKAALHSEITNAKTEIESMLSIRLGVDNEE